MKLLIVDDSSAVYRRLIDLLGGVEHLTSLSVARSLPEARDKCCEVQPDVIILDIRLREGNALELLGQLKSMCPAALLFVFSNLLDYRHKALDAGADEFYDKSMEFARLVLRLLNMQTGAGLLRDAVVSL